MEYFHTCYQIVFVKKYRRIHTQLCLQSSNRIKQFCTIFCSFPLTTIINVKKILKINIKVKKANINYTLTKII